MIMMMGFIAMGGGGSESSPFTPAKIGRACDTVPVFFRGSLTQQRTVVYSGLPIGDLPTTRVTAYTERSTKPEGHGFAELVFSTGRLPDGRGMSSSTTPTIQQPTTDVFIFGVPSGVEGLLHVPEAEIGVLFVSKDQTLRDRHGRTLMCPAEVECPHATSDGQLTAASIENICRKPQSSGPVLPGNKKWTFLKVAPTTKDTVLTPEVLLEQLPTEMLPAFHELYALPGGE